MCILILKKQTSTLPPTITSRQISRRSNVSRRLAASSSPSASTAASPSVGRSAILIISKSLPLSKSNSVAIPVNTREWELHPDGRLKRTIIAPNIQPIYNIHIYCIKSVATLTRHFYLVSRINVQTWLRCLLSEPFWNHASLMLMSLLLPQITKFDRTFEERTRIWHKRLS